MVIITFSVHTFATEVCLKQGVPIESVSKILGHTNIHTTQIYARMVDRKLSQDIYVTYYNLEAIIFLSYRIDSRFAKFFREWVVNALCKYNRMEKKEAEVIVVFNSNTKQSSLSYPNIPN